MKTKSKIFFFILILFLIFIPISSFAPFARASEIADPVINTDILSVQLGSFEDSTTGDGSGKLKTATGGFDLLGFENLGVYSYDEDEKTILYRARAKWGYEINAWTECLYDNIFPYIDILHETSYRFFKLVYKNHNLIGQPFTSSTQKYYSRFREIDYGTRVLSSIATPDSFGGWTGESGVTVSNSYLKHDYDGVIPVTVNIDPGFKFSGEIELAGQKFTVPLLTSDIINVKIANVRSGEVGTYEDRYTDFAGITEGTVEITILDDLFTQIVTGSSTICAWLNDQNLGWRVFRDVTSDPFQTIQQGLISEGCTGQTFSDDNPTTYDEINFGLPVHIQPEVTKNAQILEFTVAGVQYWKDSGTLKPYYGPSTETYQRDVSVHVQNYFVHYDLEMETDLFMTCQFEGELSESFLEDPNLIISDMLWDNSLLGAHKVRPGFKKDPMWWDWIIWVIVIIIVVYIAYKIYKIYMRRYRRIPQQAQQYRKGGRY